MDIENLVILLKLLKENKTDFVIIGGMALPAHGYSRNTFDLDILIRPTKENAQRCCNSLRQYGYDLQDTKVEEFLQKKILFRKYLLAVDIHSYVKGVDFKQVWKNKKRARIGKTYAYFASLDDLILMKKASGRAIDKEDLKYLFEIRKRVKKNLRKKGIKRSKT